MRAERGALTCVGAEISVEVEQQQPRSPWQRADGACGLRSLRLGDGQNAAPCLSAVLINAALLFFFFSSFFSDTFACIHKAHSAL